MTKVYTLAMLLCLGGSLSAQRLNNAALFNFEKPSGLSEAAGSHLRPEAPASHLQRDVQFNEDFANGLSGNNGIGAWTISGVNGNVWKWSDGSPYGAYTGRNGSQRIESTTTANGYMIFNSDSANTNWSDTTIVASPVLLVGSLTSPVIDLSASPNVALVYSSRMRYCCRQAPGHYVEVSTNGGQDWTRINVDVEIPYYVSPNTDLATNDDSGTRTFQVNLVNAISANPANVQIRFTQEGTPGDNGNALSHYIWQIDDVQIIDLAPNDMRSYAALPTYWNLNAAYSYDSLIYPIMPISELRGRTLSMAYFNNGSTTSNNVQAHFTTDDGFQQVIDLGDVAPGFADTARVSNPPGWVPTSTLGTHKIYFALTADGMVDPSLNRDTARVIVSQYTYARDENSRDNNISDNADGDPFKAGNKFFVSADQMLYGIDVGFASVSEVGVELNAQLLDPNTSGYPELAETGYHNLVTADLSPLGGNHMVSFIFDNPVQLTAGTDYMVVVQHFGGADVRVATSGVSPAQTSNLYSGSESTWYYTTTTPMVRMNFNPAIGIAENDFNNGIGLGQNYPNPANTGSTRIDFSLDKAAAVSMDLRDISGKLVQTLVNGNMAQGIHHVDVNTENLGAGVYFYTLTTGKATSTKRMTVVR